jgi:hypothetical protein
MLSYFLSNMPLTNKQNAYFESLALERRGMIDDKFHAESYNFGGFDKNIWHQLFLQRIKDYARETIDSRVTTYIETFRRYGKYPDENDVKTFSDEARKYALDKKELFPKYCRGFFSPRLPDGMVDSITQTLSFELQTIFSKALFPLYTFHLEGQAHEEVSGAQLIDEEQMSKSKESINVLENSNSRNNINLQGIQGSTINIVNRSNHSQTNSTEKPETTWLKQNIVGLIGSIIATLSVLIAAIALIVSSDFRKFLGLP